MAAAYQDGGRGATGGDRGPRAAGTGRHADNREGDTQAAAARQGGGGDEQAGPAWQREEAAHRRPQEGGVPRCLSATTCAGADRRGLYRRKERAMADAGGGRPLSWKALHPPPARRPALAREEPRPVRPGKMATPRRPPWQGKPPCRPARKRGRPGVRRERGDRLRGRDDEPLRRRRRASSAPPDDGGRILARGSAGAASPALPGEGAGRRGRGPSARRRTRPPPRRRRRCSPRGSSAARRSRWRG